MCSPAIPKFRVGCPNTSVEDVNDSTLTGRAIIPVVLTFKKSIRNARKTPRRILLNIARSIDSFCWSRHCRLIKLRDGGNTVKFDVINLTPLAYTFAAVIHAGSIYKRTFSDCFKSLFICLQPITSEALHFDRLGSRTFQPIKSTFQSNLMLSNSRIARTFFVDYDIAVFKFLKGPSNLGILDLVAGNIIWLWLVDSRDSNRGAKCLYCKKVEEEKGKNHVDLDAALAGC